MVKFISWIAVLSIAVAVPYGLFCISPVAGVFFLLLAACAVFGS